MTTNLSLAAKHIKDCNALMITAGAGMGVDSGLPDFRGNEGFWKAYPPIAKMGISFYEMANPQWFQKDPKLAWAFYGHRQNLYRNTAPHAGFNQILEQAEHKRDGYFVFTSNVDGQFQKAGFSEDFIEECHGSIHHLQCSVPCSSTIWSADGFEIEIDLDKFQALDPLPLCPNCNALARPNILMFGDWGWISHRTGKQGERLSQWLESVKERKSNLVILEIGAGNAVPTVRNLSENIALNLNAKLIRINLRDSEVPKGHISIPESGAEGIRNLLGY